MPSSTEGKFPLCTSYISIVKYTENDKSIKTTSPSHDLLEARHLAEHISGTFRTINISLQPSSTGDFEIVCMTCLSWWSRSMGRKFRHEWVVHRRSNNALIHSHLCIRPFESRWHKTIQIITHLHPHVLYRSNTRMFRGALKSKLAKSSLTIILSTITRLTLSLRNVFTAKVYTGILKTRPCPALQWNTALTYFRDPLSFNGANSYSSDRKLKPRITLHRALT